MPAFVRRSVLALLVSAATVGACAGRIENVIRAQAAMDMSCPEGQITVRAQGSRTKMRDYAVSACGRERSYQAACNSLGTCVAYPVSDLARGDSRAQGIDLWADKDAPPDPAAAAAPEPATEAVVTPAAAAELLMGADVPVGDDAPAADDVPAAEVPIAEVPIAEAPAVVRAPLGEPRVVTLRNDCERTVALFIGEDPVQGAGRYTSLGSTNTAMLRLRQGEPVWLIDKTGAAVASIVVAREVEEIAVIEGCDGFAPR